MSKLRNFSKPLMMAKTVISVHKELEIFQSGTGNRGGKAERREIDALFIELRDEL